MFKKILAWIPSNVGALVGIVQSIVTFVREVAILFGRLVAPIIPGDIDDVWASRVAGWADKANEALEKVKDFLLNIGG